MDWPPLCRIVSSFQISFDGCKLITRSFQKIVLFLDGSAGETWPSVSFFMIRFCQFQNPMYVCGESISLLILLTSGKAADMLTSGKAADMSCLPTKVKKWLFFLDRF